MALKAGYYGVKKNVLDELNQLDGAKIIKSVGAGLNFNSSTGALSCKSATNSQAGIAKASDYIGKDVGCDYPFQKSFNADTGAVDNLSIGYDTKIADNTGAYERNLITSKGVYKALHTPTALYETNQNIKAVDDAFVLPEVFTTYSKIFLVLGRSNIADGFQYYELPTVYIGQYTLVSSYQESSGTLALKQLTLEKGSDNKTFTVKTSTYGSSDFGIRNVYLYD